MASYVVCQSLGISPEKFEKALASFSPLDHRFQTVGKVDDVTFIDDSISTIPESAIAAVDACGESENITLILGGKDRKQDYTELARAIASNTSVKFVITLGETATKIDESLRESCFSGELCNMRNSSMSEIVEKAHSVTKPDGIVLLSPAASSFDMFRDYKDRGDQFKSTVKALSA